MKLAIVVVVVVALAIAQAAATPKILTKEFIDSINERQNSWTAGQNFDENMSRAHMKSLLGLREDFRRNRLPALTHVDTDVPENFDAREQWPDCKSIGQVKDQSVCGSCWAFGAAEAMTDRICIHSDGKVKKSVSAEDLMTCCYECGFGCEGGFLYESWSYWVDSGIATGGGYNTSDGCRSYSFAECEHHTTGSKPTCGDSQPTPDCVKKCDDSSMNYKEELTFGKSVYSITGPKQIQIEIMKNGPVEAAFTVYDDFLLYKKGVYKHLEGEYLGGHAIKILGWGVENDTPYWLIANSWNEDWGDQGYFKILRGKNHVGIEGEVVAGLPKLD
ncbi:unnamed protein product [Brassicogethes aeneus]|uniref:Peptidase C1A papain C-terminal domain-containing protein n=1 Tax=Brassicogethes aeneus TaxID=1431903 RepID=A0A9P0AVL8_BRAAE|nr:unnamed protein product [Brassicogethes aeneus]